ncbi:MAG: hypothetical protein LC118_03655 [Dehalococcoidia bacterium]|nr:hypothetical protein [Dehalococcoidia bacterium]
MSLSWIATIVLAVVLGALSVLRDSTSGTFEGVVVGTMIVVAVLFIGAFLSAILLPVWLRRR